MVCKYPNLELLVYKAKQIYKHGISGSMYDGERTPVMQNAKLLDEEIFAFRQTWATTAKGFDLDGGVSGQMFTDEYTTVVKLHFCFQKSEGYDGMDLFVIFFGDRIAYYGVDPNEEFFIDLSRMEMKSQKNQHYFDEK